MKLTIQKFSQTKFLYLIWCFIFFSSIIWAAPPVKPQITGQVLDNSGIPVAGVTVSTTTRGVTATTTNSNGIFALSGMKKNAILVINLTKAGYVSSQKLASVKKYNYIFIGDTAENRRDPGNFRQYSGDVNRKWI